MEEAGNMGIARREFMAGLGGLFAVSSLPAFGEDDPSVFPARGKFERLNISYAHVAAGATEPFSILHISDTHLTAAYPDEGEACLNTGIRRQRTFGGRQEEALRDSLGWAKSHVDHVLHTGDLIDWQSRANFDLVRKYFGDGMFGCVGNHEFKVGGVKYARTEEYKANGRDALASAYPFDIGFSAKTVNGVTFVTLDDVFGTVRPEAVERFRAEAAKGVPIVLCMHVPFFSGEIWRAHVKYWAGDGRKFRSVQAPNPAGDYRRQLDDPVTRDFIAYLKREPLLKCILAGHLHITVDEQFSDTARQYVVGGNYGFCGREVLFT